MMSRARFAAARSEGEAQTLAKCVPQVMSDASAMVFQGLRSDGLTEGLCYVGCPPSKFSAGGVERISGDDEMFFVFVCEERTIFNWRWERVSKAELDANLQDRFLRRVR